MVKNSLAEYTRPGLHSALIEELPEVSQDASILDIGCGTGAWLERLAELNYSALYGIDINMEQFQSNRAKGFQLNLDCDEIPGFGVDRFDLITAIELVEHLENPGRLFRHISNLLAPSGYALVTTPNIHSLIARLRFLLSGRLKGFDEKSNQDHIYPVYLPCLERIIDRYSLEIVRISTHPKRGSTISRGSLRLASYLSSFFLEDKFSGDNLFLLIQRRGASRGE